MLDLGLSDSAEVPGMIFAAVAVEYLGRKLPMAAGLLISGAAILGLLATPATALMFVARAGVMGAFTVLYIYTPEVRSQGLEREGGRRGGNKLSEA